MSRKVPTSLGTMIMFILLGVMIGLSLAMAVVEEGWYTP